MFVCKYFYADIWHFLSVLNAATHLVFSARRSECITLLFRELHWLRVPERVTFGLGILAYRCVHGTAPAYLLRTSNVSTRHCLRSADTAMLGYCPPDVQRSVIVPSQWLRHVCRTACRHLSGTHRRWRCSVASWRLYFSGRRLTMTRWSWLYCTV